MKQKKIKKLVLKKETISNLTKNSMSDIKGGNETDGTGLAPCQCNPTDYCCHSGIYESCIGGADTSRPYCACT